MQIILVLSFFICLTNAQLYYHPEQIHLSIGVNDGEYVLTWVTQTSTNQSTVLYGSASKPFGLKATGVEDSFVDGGKLKRQIFIHRVVLSALPPNTRFYYIVGSSYGWSAQYSFETLQTGTNWSPRLVVYGDMGNKNGQSIPYLQLDAEQGAFDMILHIGDFAYDMDTNDAYYGDEFMRQIEPIATLVPYMTCPGNHENAYNFSNYRNRFTMPGGDGQGQYYSINVGPAHIILYNTEFYYFTNYGWKQIEQQYNWLLQDLKEANKPENRAARPWIIAMGHRPMYCSNNDDNMHCVNVNNIARTGIPYDGTFLFGLEEIFYENGVDLLFWAHEHSYERMWPVYNLKVCNGTGTSDQVYVDPPGPIHIVTGSAGNQEGEDPFIPGGQPWSAFRSDDYGYTRLNILNGTHLTLDQVSTDKQGQIVDKLLYVRNKHGANVFNCH